MTNGHNGSKVKPSRDQILMTAAYYAAVEGHYDTSRAAQKSNLLTISIVDMANIPGEVLPPGATKFYVMIDASAYMVTRYPDETYQVEPHDQTADQRAERELREAVLDTALWYLTGEGAGYYLGAGEEARAAAIKALLEGGPEGAEPEARDPSDPISHPVIRVRACLAPGEPGEAGPHALKQWVVEIGPYNRCEVVFFGYDAENGTPELITQEVEEDDYDEDDEETE